MKRYTNSHLYLTFIQLPILLLLMLMMMLLLVADFISRRLYTVIDNRILIYLYRYPIAYQTAL